MAGQNSISNKLNSNSINTLFNLEQFLDMENYGTVRRNDRILSTKK